MADANKDGVIDWMQNMDLFENVDTDNESDADRRDRIKGVFQKYNTSKGDVDEKRQEVLDAAEFKAFTRCYLKFLDASKEWTDAEVEAKVEELLKKGDTIARDGDINLWEFNKIFVNDKDFKMKAK